MTNLDIMRRRGPAPMPPKLQDIKRPILPTTALPKFSWPKFLLPRIPWKPVSATVLGVAVLASLVLVYLPSAAITVTARSEPVARDFELRVDPSLDKASSEDLAIPGRIIEHEVSGSKQIQATGKKNVGKTASGFISIYNFSKTTLILKAQTTSLTANGRAYYFTQDVSGIRPTAFIGIEDQEVDESSLIPPVPVNATSAGEEFNLPAGTRVEISNEAFGSQPKVLYGVVSEGITGGTTEIVKLVTSNDIEGGLSQVTQDLVVKGKAELAGRDSDLRISDNAIQTEIVEQYSDKQPGAEVNEFSVAARMKIRALTYDENDLKKVVFERVERLLPETKKLSIESVVLDSSLINVKLSEGIAMLQAHFEGKVQYELSHTELLEKVRGKSAEEIREIFLSKPEIDSLTVEFFPFWVKTAPLLRDRIKLDVR